LSVSNIHDAAGNSLPANTTFTYQIPGSSSTDTTPPQLAGVIVKGPTQIDLSFSEGLDKASVENKSNYSINNNIEVMGAVLDANLTTVHIITSSHRSGQYTITVNRIKDAAGNQIAANSKATYTVTSEQPPEDPGNGQTPNNFTLFQNYPNPFNPETEIRFFLERSRRIELKVYNPLGQLVRTLVKTEMPAGFHTIVWDGTNSDGIQMPTGVYIYALEVNRDVVKGDLLVNVAMERRVKKMALIR
jgi:flagellar hook assembly protein FlgD